MFFGVIIIVTVGAIPASLVSIGGQNPYNWYCNLQRGYISKGADSTAFCFPAAKTGQCS